MKNLILLIYIIFNFNSFGYSFNVIDRLASPFIDDYSDTSSEYNDDTSIKRNTQSTKSALPILIIGIIFILISPTSRYKRYGVRYNRSDYGYSYLGAELGELLIKLIEKKSDKSFKEFTEEDLQRRENEVIELLSQINIKADDIKKLARYTIEEYFKFLKREKNDLREISNEALYNKYLKEIAEMQSRELKFEINNLEIEDIKIVNIRYTDFEKALSVYIRFNSQIYYIDAITKNFVSGDRFPIKRGIFLTYIYENDSWKLSLIENKVESYVMKLENIVGIKGAIRTNFKNTLNISTSQIEREEIPKPKLQLMVAENFYELYQWWIKPDNTPKTNIDENLFERLKEERNKIKTDPSINFEIKDIKIISIDFLHHNRTPAQVLKGFIVRIKFSIKGKFSKNSMMLFNDEKEADEIWEFEIEDKKVILKDILKRFINSPDEIEPLPLQIEWYI